MYNPLTTTEFDSASADDWKTQVPTLSTFLSGLMVFGGGRGMPMLPLGEDLLDIRLENANGQRHGIGTYKFDDTIVSNPAAVRDQANKRAPWIPEDGPGKYLMGITDEMTLNAPSSDGSGSWDWTISVPFNWWRVDLAQLLFVLVRFYSGGGTTARDHLDRDALIAYSAGSENYLRRVHLWTHRKVGESIATHIRRLAVESGAMIRWGGFENDSNTIQCLGLGVFDWDMLEEMSQILDFDTGVDMFAVEALSIRTAHEYVLNVIRRKWGEHVVQVTQGGSTAVTWESPADPATPDGADGPANQLEHSDAASVTSYGERIFTLEQPSIVEPSGADVALRPYQWRLTGREFVWAMGPLHFDFDVLDLYYGTHEAMGLDQSAAILVTKKTIDWETLNATIEGLEVVRAWPELEPDDASIVDRLGMWHRADSVVTSGSDVTQWTDLSGNGRHATAGATKPQLVSAAINGEDAIDFSGYGGLFYSGLSVSGVTGLVGRVYFAVVEIDDPVFISGDGWVFSSKHVSSGYGWAVGLRDEGGIPSYAWRFRGSTGAENHMVGWAATRSWQILCWVHERPDTNEDYRFEVIRDEAGVGAEETALWSYLDWSANAAVGAYHDGTEVLPGKLAEVIAFDDLLSPGEIRGVFSYLQARYGLQPERRGI